MTKSEIEERINFWLEELEHEELGTRKWRRAVSKSVCYLLRTNNDGDMHMAAAILTNAVQALPEPADENV